MKKLINLALLLPLALSACNLTITVPQGDTSLPLDQQAATIVAMTLTAQVLPAQTQPLATPTIGPASTIQPNLTATVGAGTPTATTLTVDSNTNCREGPGSSYAVVIILVAGTTYQIISRTADNTYWIVTEPGSTTVCWVPAEFSNAFGDVSLLPIITPSAPTSVAGPLTAPTGLKYGFSCSFNGPSGDYTITVNLSWTDRSNNETGFYMYRNGTLIATLSAGSTVYTDIFIGGSLQLYTYQVAAYNAQGQALGTSISFTCNS